MPTLFISYSSKDKKFSEKLATDLKNLGIGIWLDKWEIKVGDSIIEKIGKGIKDNDFLGIVLSPNSVSSNWVRKELSAALIKELKSKSVVILPILLRDCEIPPLISDKKYADFRYNYDNGLRELVEVLISEKTNSHPVSKRKEKTDDEEIKRCWHIFGSPFSKAYTKEAAFERLIKLRAFEKLKTIVNDIWEQETFKERALDVLAKNPKGNEDFLFSVVNNVFTSDKLRRIALEGLIRAKASNYLLELIDNFLTAEWIRKHAAEALKSL